MLLSQDLKCVVQCIHNVYVYTDMYSIYEKASSDIFNRALEEGIAIRVARGGNL